MVPFKISTKVVKCYIRDWIFKARQDLCFVKSVLTILLADICNSQTKLDLLRPWCCKDDSTALLVRNCSRRLRLLRPKGERASTSSAHFLWGQFSFALHYAAAPATPQALHSRGCLQPQPHDELAHVCPLFAPLSPYLMSWIDCAPQAFWGHI